MTESPQQNYFDLSLKVKKYNALVFIAIIVLTLSNNFFNSKNIGLFCIVLLVVNILLNLLYDNFKSKAEEIRRKDLIDNSFGSSLLEINSNNYFDNDEIENGLYKLYINAFQNSFFSYKITEKMLIKETVIVTLITLIVISSMIYGFISSLLITPIIQIYLVKICIEGYLKTREYNSKVKIVFENYKSIFDNTNKKDSNFLRYNQSRLINNLFLYEINIAEKNMLLSSKVYSNLNDSLTEEWKEIKKKYSIV